jgi:ABC-type nitrate/sulfonate/bicarbonate transport system substrate-binding protein
MPRALSRRELLLGASGAALSGSLPMRPATAAPRRTDIKIASAGGALNLAMAQLMRQEKFLESFDLAPDVLVVADGTRILGAVVSGSIDASMMSGFGQVFPAVERGAAIKVLAGGALLPGVALFSAKPEVRTLKDLEGRAIGTGSIGALIYQLTVGLLEKYKVDTSRMRFVNIGSSTDIFRAVATGTVDGGLADAALIDTAAEHHVHLVEHGNLSVELPEYTYQGAWASDQKIQTEREVLVRALAAYAKLYRFVQDPHSREAFMRARRSAFPTAPETDHLAQWHYIQTYKPFAVDLVPRPERLRYMQELNVRFKAQRQIMPFERIADMSLAADAVKLLEGKPTSRG